MMRFFRIRNCSSGVDLGVHPGETPEEALASMVQGRHGNTKPRPPEKAGPRREVSCDSREVCLAGGGYRRPNVVPMRRESMEP